MMRSQDATFDLVGMVTRVASLLRRCCWAALVLAAVSVASAELDPYSGAVESPEVEFLRS